jgi:hypothetical protein
LYNASYKWKEEIYRGNCGYGIVEIAFPNEIHVFVLKVFEIPYQEVP